MYRYFVLASLALAASGAHAQPQSDASSAATRAAASSDDETPWGYVYAFRTQRGYALTGKDSRFGRLPENDVPLTSPRVSRRHAAIRRSDDGIQFVDVGSSNGSRVNGKNVRARVPVTLAAGDRIQLADELLLFHTSLDGLWNAELRMRLLSSMIKMNVHLPQDFKRKSLGREETVPVESEALIDLAAGTVRLDRSVKLDPSSGFFTDVGAFIGNVTLEDGELELSLWAIEGAGSMTSRRASIARLKHTTLRVVMVGESDGPSSELRPWYPQQHLTELFDIFSEARDLSLQFSTSLASQERAVALRDASEVLAFRHMVSPEPEWNLLTLSARAGARWVETTVLEQRMRLTQIERNELAESLELSRARLESARSLGAGGESVEQAAAAIESAATRLAALEAQ